jgi:hypothetical protein
MGERIFINSGHKIQKGDNSTKRGTVVKVISTVDTMWEKGGVCNTVVQPLRGRGAIDSSEGNSKYCATRTLRGTNELTPWRRVPLKKPLVAQLLNSFATFYGTQRLSPCSQEPSTGPFREPDQSSPYHHILSKIHFNIIFISMSS